MAAPKKFETDKKYYKQVKGTNGKTKRVEVSVFNGITFDDIVDWLEENGTAEDKAAFKEALFSYKDGKPMPFETYKGTGEKYQKTNFINAKRKFFERHNPAYLPQKKQEETKEKKTNRIASW